MVVWDQYCFGLNFNEIASLDERAFELFNVNRNSFFMVDDKPYFIIDDDYIGYHIRDVASIYKLTDEQVDKIRNRSCYYYLLIDSQNKLYTTDFYYIWDGCKNNALQVFMEDHFNIEDCCPMQITIDTIDKLENVLNKTIKHPFIMKVEQILGKKLLDCTYDNLWEKNSEINSIDIFNYEMPKELCPAKEHFYGLYELSHEWLENLINVKVFIDEFRATYKDFDYTFYSCLYKTWP